MWMTLAYIILFLKDEFGIHFYSPQMDIYKYEKQL